MSTPHPMATPNLADLLAKKPATAPSRRGVPPTVAQPATTSALDTAPQPAHPDNTTVPAAPRSAAADPNPVAPPAPVGQASTAAAGERREYLRSIALYLPRTIHQQLGGAAAELGTTRTALILAAVNSTHERLGAALTATTAPARSHDLFTVPQNKTSTEPSVQTTIRVTDAQHSAITALVAENHTNRSRLVTTALQLHLRKT